MDKSVEMIGMFTPSTVYYPVIHTKHWIVFENSNDQEVNLSYLTFEMDSDESWMGFGSNTWAYAHRCTFNGQGCSEAIVRVFHNAHFWAQDCIFEESDAALKISSTAICIRLAQCRLRWINPPYQYSQGCIIISDDDHNLVAKYAEKENLSHVKIEFLKNHFEEIDQNYTFVWESVINAPYTPYIKSRFPDHVSQIQDNVLNGAEYTGNDVNELQCILNDNDQ